MNHHGSGGDPRYERLARQEARHWSTVAQDPQNPQIWDDPVLQEIFFGEVERGFVARAAACGPRVLELGCGEGDLALELARRGCDVTATDSSPKRVHPARALAGAGGPWFVVGDLNTMKLPPGPFDAVVAHDALHHLVELEALLERVERVLARDGRLLVLDFAGMGRVARVLSAAVLGLLPTYMPYRRKWEWRRRLGAFLATERDKRAALARGGGEALHDASPFEGISQESIVPAIARRFEIVEHRSFLPFFWYLAPKLRLGRWKHRVAKLFRTWDDGLQRARVARGAYFIVEAKRRAPAP